MRQQSYITEFAKLRPEIQNFYQRVHGGQVFIIGGGPSVKPEEINKINSENMVCVNSSYKLLKKWLAIYWMDDQWITEHEDDLKNHDIEYRFTSLSGADIYIDKNKHKRLGDAIVLRRTGSGGFDPNYDNVRGNNSGTQVLNLIINMNPKQIVLLGFDMTDNDGRTHWHDDYQTKDPSYLYRKRFLPTIESMAEQVKTQKPEIDIVNCSEISKIEGFRKDSLHNVTC